MQCTCTENGREWSEGEEEELAKVKVKVKVKARVKVKVEVQTANREVKDRLQPLSVVYTRIQGATFKVMRTSMTMRRNNGRK